MLSTRARRWLSLYLVGMIVLNAFVFWRSWNGIRIGLPDFSIFYTAGKIVNLGRGADLYDDKLQEEVQESFLPLGIQKRGALLPYNHPPFEAVLFAPFAHVSYLDAYFLWLAVNVAILLSLPRVLRPHFAVLGKEPLAFWLLACFAFFPTFIALMQGQDSILILLFYCLAYSAFRSDSELRMGGWLGMGLCKFHLVLPFFLSLAILIRKKFIAGFMVVSAALLLVGTAVVGVKGWLKYPAYIWASDQNSHLGWNVSLGKSANLRALVSSLLPAAYPWLRATTLVLLAGTLFAGTVYAWQRTLSADASRKALAFCVGLGATVLLTFHLYPHDLSLLFLVLLLAFESTLSAPRMRLWARKTIYSCLGLLSCAPVYLVLTLRYKQLQVIAVILLVLLFVIWTQIVRPGIVMTTPSASPDA